MPENSMKQRQQRPTSDIILETGRKLLTEVEKSTVADSNKHVSMLLARSRSLDVLSSANHKLAESKINNNLKSKESPGIISSDEEKDCEQLDMYVANSCLEETSSNSAESSTNYSTAMEDEFLLSSDKNQNLTLLKEKSELNNNNHASENKSEDFHANRSSCGSSISTASSNCSRGGGKSDHNKLQRRSSSTLEGATAFQEVVLKTEPIRITGYLEKRSKVLGWKKFWFVLDGRLLTYYKSKADYESLSACCGCINLGIASTVRPIQIRGCKGYPLQIVTRSQVYYLRSQEKPTLEQWLIAIQEAASSPPSTSVLSSWNSYTGSQYFRQSQSQWSLNNSSEDITNIADRLGNLPDTFYQNRDRNSLALTNPSHISPVIQKYHSFTSLQTPIINDFTDRRRILISSSENLRDLKDGKSISSLNPAMQNSSSLLLLDSSPQAAELRKELTRKLWMGSSKNGHNNCPPEDDTVPSAKFLLLSAKKKLQLGPGGDNESHDYAEIGDFIEGGKNSKPYENCDVENPPPTQSISRQQSMDNRSTHESTVKDSNIYEHIETMGSIPNSNQTPPVVIWESLNENNGSMSNNKRFPMHRMSGGSNRNSLVSISELPEDVSSLSPSPAKTPMLTSIPEFSWKSGIEPYKNYHQTCSEDDLSSCRSESFRSLPCVEKSEKKRKGKAFGFLSKVFGKNKGKGSKSGSPENLQRPMVISGPVDLRNRGPQDAVSEVFPEIRPAFTGTSNKQIVNRSTVNTADQQPQDAMKTSPIIPGSRMTINNTIVMDELKQKVGHITLKRTNSKDEGSRVVESPPRENKIQQGSSKPNSTKAKLEPRVPYVPRANSNTNACPSPNKPTPVLMFPTENRSFESNTDDDTVASLEPEPQNETQIATICMSPEIETPSPETNEQEVVKAPVSKPTLTDTVLSSESSSKTNNSDADFQNKLAKFNRLSQKLSASFIAAAMNPSLHPNHHIGRSQSYKAQKHKQGKHISEVLPPLPPKKKNGSSGTIPIYDVPLNNRPVGRSESLKISSRTRIPSSEGNSITAYIRGITKKNSTPDILSGNSAKLFGLSDDDPKDFKRSSVTISEDNFDVHNSTPALPPPRPPKPKPPQKPKSLESGLGRSKRNSESSSGSSETVAEPQLIISPSETFPTPVLQLTLEAASPTTSNKSLDIDTLDALSDVGLSDTKASNSPPDSPKICPLHPQSTLRDDMSLSTIARTTPDSLMTVTDEIVPDSLGGTPDTEIFQPSTTVSVNELFSQDDPETAEPISINKLEIVIDDNDGSPDLLVTSPHTESRMDSLERSTVLDNGVLPKNTTIVNTNHDICQNIKFATVSTLIQEFETVQENEDEISELYDDFPAEFYTPTPSSFSGYCPSDVSSTSTGSPLSSSTSLSSPMSSTSKKHACIDAIRNSGMEQLEAFLSFGSTSSSDDCSFESCTDNFPEESIVKTSNDSPTAPISVSNNNNNNIGKKGPIQTLTTTGVNRTGAISRLGHSSAVGHLQKILTSDVK